MARDLADAYTQLLARAIEVDAPGIPVVECEGSPGVFVGLGEEQAPVVFIRVVPGPPLTELRLNLLRARWSAQLLLVRANGQQEGAAFTALECLSPDPEVRELFLRACTVVASQLPEPRAAGPVREMLAGFVNLFRLLAQPAQHTALGLWGELLLLSRVQGDINPAAMSWHALPTQLHDFSLGRAAVEVKITRGAARRHSFSLSQLSPPTGVSVVVASMLTDETGGGMSLAALYREVRDRCAPATISHVDNVVALTLGDSLPAAMRMSFDDAKARDTLRFFAAGSIPRVQEPVPPEVTEVRFKADLASVSPGRFGREALFSLLCR